MTKRFFRIIWFALFLVTFIQCGNSKIKNTIKCSPNDPFKNTIVPSQIFDIDSKQDNVIEGENGTIIVCPKGCFKNKNGDIVEGKVTIELAEALQAEDMLMSNLTTTSNGKPLETDGMIYFNVTENGEQLVINKKIPVHIEIPTSEKRPGMKAYEGIRDENGNMNWIRPKELTNFLVPVDINTLDFLPPGFQTEVSKGMPYKNHKTATQELTDSMYYSLSRSMQEDLLWSIDLELFKQNEPYYHKGTQKDKPSRIGRDTCAHCGITPAIIKVIKTEKFQNTFIATREFEARLKLIFKTCDNSVLETYICNLDKNLYEVDEMAAKVVTESEYKDAFLNFSKQRLTKVKEADKYASLLKGYYKEQLAKVKSELEERQAKLMKEANNKKEEIEKVADDYKKLLCKREKYRMETYGFNWTKTGWINIDNGDLPKDWSSQPLEIAISNGKQFDRVCTYVFYTSIKSLYRLNTNDNIHFFAGNEGDKEMLMPNRKLGIAISIGYKGETPSLAVKEFETASQPKFTMTLSLSTKEKVEEAIRPYEKHAKENSIQTDLEFMATFYKEEQRQKGIIKENTFMLRLLNIAFPCCPVNLDSEGAK